MTKQVINVGIVANDKRGDPLRTAFTKANQNFTELYTLTSTIPTDVSDLTDTTNLLGGGGSTGLFSFDGNSVTISNDDMDLITTRTGWDTDADIGLDAADDIWITAQGDELALSAANDVTISSRTSPMYNSIFYGDEDDFVGTWDGATVTIATIDGSTLDGLMAEYVANSDRPIWLETSAGFVELNTNAVAQNTDPGVYTITVSTSSPSANLNIISMKVWDNTQTYNSNWTFRRDGVTQIPGPIDFDTRTINLHNGGNQTAQILQFNTAGYQAVITGPTPADGESAQRLIIQGQRAIGQGEGGDVYVWGGDSDLNGGDIKIYAGDADDGAAGTGGYVNIDGGYGYDQGGDVHISGGNSNLSGGSVTLTAGGGTTNGVIYLQTYGNTWTLDSNGALTLPVGGDIKDNSGNSVLVSGARFVEAPASSTGQIGDLQGDIAFNNSYMYYCKQDYAGLTFTTIPTTNAVDYGTPMRFRADVADASHLDGTLRLYNCVINGVIVEYANIESYALVSGTTYDFFITGLTGSFQNSTVRYNAEVLPDIWKRVAWSNDTW